MFLLEEVYGGSGSFCEGLGWLLFSHSIFHLDYQPNYVARYIRLSLYMQGFEGTVRLLGATRGQSKGYKVIALSLAKRTLSLLKASCGGHVVPDWVC